MLIPVVDILVYILFNQFLVCWKYLSSITLLCDLLYSVALLNIFQLLIGMAYSCKTLLNVCQDLAIKLTLELQRSLCRVPTLKPVMKTLIRYF